MFYVLCLVVVLALLIATISRNVNITIMLAFIIKIYYYIRIVLTVSTTHCQKKSVMSGGFALPTILIASFVMLFVLSAVSVSVSSGTTTALDTTHYNRYARNAAQSGLEMAIACLKANSYSVTWSNANPLRPNTNCSGTVQSSVSVYTYDDTTKNLRSSFSVPLPETITSGTYRISVNASAERTRESNGDLWRQYSANTKAVVSSTRITQY